MIIGDEYLQDKDQKENRSNWLAYHVYLIWSYVQVKDAIASAHEDSLTPGAALDSIK